MSTLCINAYAGMSAWFCYFYAGVPTPGKTNLNASGECEACAKVSATVETLPNFMTNEAND